MQMYLYIYMQKFKALSQSSVSSEQLSDVVTSKLLLASGETGLSTNLIPQCQAFSRALKIEKLKTRLGPCGAGDTNDWCIIWITTSFM